MTVSERLTRAKDKVQLIVDGLIHHIRLHENNALIVHSPLLTDQIPKSFAANAFNIVQESIFHYEIVRLCTFWDGIDLDKANIPTVVELVDDPNVLNEVAKARETDWLDVETRDLDPSADPAIQAQRKEGFRALNEEFAREQAAKAMQRLKEAISSTRNTLGSSKLKSAMNLRNKHLAHRLEKTREEKKGTVAPMMYGDERKLLAETITIVDGLHLSINGAGFTWDRTQEIARRNAEYLWQGCTIKVLR